LIVPKNRILILARARFRRQALALLPLRKEGEYFGGFSSVFQRSSEFTCVGNKISSKITANQLGGKNE